MIVIKVIMMMSLFFMGSYAVAAEKDFKVWSARILQDDEIVFAKLAKSLERFGVEWHKMSINAQMGVLSTLTLAASKDVRSANKLGDRFIEVLSCHGRIAEDGATDDLVRIICRYLDGIDLNSNLASVLTICLIFEQDDCMNINSFLPRLFKILEKDIQYYGAEAGLLRQYENARKAMIATGKLLWHGRIPLAIVVSELPEDRLAGMAEFATLDWIKSYSAMGQNVDLLYNQEVRESLNSLIKFLIEFMKLMPEMVDSPIAQICIVSRDNKNVKKYPLSKDQFIMMAGMGMFYHSQGKLRTLKRTLINTERDWLRNNFNLSFKEGTATIEEGQFEVGRSDGILKIKLLT